MSPRRGCKKDANQDAIVEALESVGLFVIDAHEFAQYHAGIADLLVHWHERMAYVEVKAPGGKLTKDERAFRQRCEANRVPYVILDNVDVALAWGQAWRKGR